jgi:membrane-bound serine protease (ClpP class)
MMRWKRYLLALGLLLASAWIYAQSAQSVWVVPIDGEINSHTAHFVTSRIDQANREQPLALLFLINTPGGRIDAAQTISEAILQRAQVPTLAVVQNAFSAGALIAMSAEQLAMLPGSDIGAALAVTLDPTTSTGLKPAAEKINSAWRSQFRSVAQARGRNAKVAAAMVDESIAIPGLVTNQELVTLTAEEAVKYGIANVDASTLSDALSKFGYGGAPLVTLEPTLTERLATFFTQPLVFGALLAIGILGILIELLHPGVALPGIIGTIALVLAFGGAFLATPAGILDIVLLLIGLGLLVVEIFVIPGFGVAGILGIACIIFAVVRIFQGESIYVISYTVLFSGALVGLTLWLLPNTFLFKRLRLSTTLSPGSALPTRAMTSAAQGASSGGLSQLVGQQGVASSDLRPAGIARFGSLRVDVVTEGDYVSRGTPVEALEVRGSRVVVRTLESEG